MERRANCGMLAQRRVGLFPFQTEDRLDARPVFTAGTVPAHFLALESAGLAAVSRLVGHERFRKAAQDRGVAERALF